MKRRGVKILLRKMQVLLFVISLILLPCFQVNVKAAEGEILEKPMIILDKYEVTDEQIVPGEDFTLTLSLKNFNTNVAADNVMIDIANPKGIMPEYGTVSQMYIGEIRPGETKKISINYHADTVMETTYVDFNLTIIINGTTINYISLRVPVGTDVPFSVLFDKFPTSVAVGENATSSLSFEVLGDEDVKNVTHVILVDGITIGSNTIGSLMPGVTRTQNTTVTFHEPGEYNVDIAIQYIDKTEQLQSYVVNSKTITVYEKEQEQIDIPQSGDRIDTNNDAEKSLLLGLGGIVLLAVLLVIVIVSRKK